MCVCRCVCVCMSVKQKLQWQYRPGEEWVERDATVDSVVEDLLLLYLPSGFNAKFLAYSVKESQNLSRRRP